MSIKYYRILQIEQPHQTTDGMVEKQYAMMMQKIEYEFINEMKIIHQTQIALENLRKKCEKNRGGLTDDFNQYFDKERGKLQSQSIEIQNQYETKVASIDEAYHILNNGESRRLYNASLNQEKQPYQDEDQDHSAKIRKRF